MKLRRGLALGLGILIFTIPHAPVLNAGEVENANKAILNEIEKSQMSDRVYTDQSNWTVNKNSLGGERILLVAKDKPNVKGKDVGWIPSDHAVIATVKDAPHLVGWVKVQYLYFPNTADCKKPLKESGIKFREKLKEKYEEAYWNSRSNLLSSVPVDVINQYLNSEEVKKHIQENNLKGLKCLTIGEGWVPRGNLIEIEKLKKVPDKVRPQISKPSVCQVDCGALSPKMPGKTSKQNTQEILDNLMSSNDPSALERYMGKNQNFKKYFNENKDLVGSCLLPITKAKGAQNNAIVYLAKRVKEQRKSANGRMPAYTDEVSEEDQIAIELLTRVIWSEMGECGYVTSRSSAREDFVINNKWISRGTEIGFNPQYLRAAGRVIFNRAIKLNSTDTDPNVVYNYAGRIRGKNGLEPEILNDSTLGEMLKAPMQTQSFARATTQALLNDQAFTPLNERKIGPSGEVDAEMKRILCPSLDQKGVDAYKTNLENAKEAAFEIYFQQKEFEESTKLLQGFDAFSSGGSRPKSVKEKGDFSKSRMGGGRIDNEYCFAAWKLKDPPKAPPKGTGSGQ